MQNVRRHTQACMCCIVITVRYVHHGIDKSLRPERGAEVGLIEMNFRKKKEEGGGLIKDELSILYFC